MTDEIADPDYAFRFQYADGSAFQIYADGRAYIVAKNGSVLEEPKGVVINRIPLLIGNAIRHRPQSLAGCLHPGNEPLSCQYEGQCLSVSCNHHGKTEYRPRMTLLAQVDGVLYTGEKS